MKVIKLIGFWGIGFTTKNDLDKEPALIKVGHVGWQLGGDKRIYGFRPTEKAIEDAGGLEAAMIALLDKQLLDGGVFDDTQIFEYAMSLVPKLEALGTRRTTEVSQQILEVTDEEFEFIKTQTELWYTGGTFKRKYGFPNENAKEAYSNCATFPKVLGLQIPEDSGQLREYIPKLKALGQLWKGNAND